MTRELLADLYGSEFEQLDAPHAAPDDTAEAGPPTAALATAAWSPRRVPQPFVDAVGAAASGQADAEVQPAPANAPQVSSTPTFCTTAPISAGRPGAGTFRCVAA